ncbi:hypothetical protein ACP275_08G259000 [Erythranthe tilingii]
MPTFTALALDRLIEPGTTKSMVPPRNSTDSKLERRHSTPYSTEDVVIVASGSKVERGASIPPLPKIERGVSVPPNTNLERGVNIPPNPKLGWKNGAINTTTSVADKKHQWAQFSPALYATPISTPLPDSPSSFPPSPYVINHKRRGPRLMKSFSEDDVSSWKQGTDEIKVDGNGNSAEKEVVSVSKDDSCVPIRVLDSTIDGNIEPSVTGDDKEKHLNRGCNGEHGSSDMGNGPSGQNGLIKSVEFNLQQDGDVDDFVDPQDSMSVKSISESEGNFGAERTLNSTTPMAEFYDAWEELSSENGPQLPMPDFESELREIRLTLLMEIEKRKQAEETLNNVRYQWQRIREELSLVGLTLPVDPTTLPEDGADFAADVCQQVYLARFVSNSVGRGTAKAEVEMEMEAQIKLKNVEIARLWDRLHYYEAVNREMSQRNQEVVETARQLRQRRKKIRKWVWGSIATAVTVGSAYVAYSYLHTPKEGSSSSKTLPHAHEADHKSN